MSRTMTMDAIEHDRGPREALSELVWIIERAGLHNLTRGVELGQTSWYVKASDRIAYSKHVLGNELIP